MDMQFPVNDNSFEEAKIVAVNGDNNGWMIKRDDGWSFFVPGDSGVTPEVNQTARFYGEGAGFTVRGLFLNGQKVFYRTKEEDQERHRKWCEDKEKQDKEKFEATKELTDHRVSLLPLVFQQRLQRFRDNNPDFRWKFESYELMVCEQAVLFAKRFKTPEAIKNFYDKPWDIQEEMCPGLDQGHSGNSFGCAIKLATLYVTNPDEVILEHGALVPLVGCLEYGCFHDNNENVID